ncbi:MAG: TetR/AcrR family transcriptional regulator [Thiothrix sp.]|nr:TetR/AcrR family transcriptional regulator [Thiothrix sp.]HPQ94881.1 TetR/AcrR family transcriptional regulator [Thiolinea sp.]
MGKPERGTLTRHDWLKAACRVLVSEGIHRVRILTLAADLGVTRGSFYWHFDNRADLLEALIDDWRQRNTGVLLSAAASSTDFVERILAVAECWTDTHLYDPEMDTALRSWAAHDARVAALVQLEDGKRLQAFERIFTDHGLPVTEAAIRAKVFYYTQIGYFALNLKQEPVERFTFYREYFLVFTGETLPEQRFQTCLRRVLQQNGAAR